MFAKVFHQILRSSIAKNYETRHVFEDLLKLADLNGVVDMPHDAIARETNVPEEMIRKAIVELEQPDKLSRTPDHDGRRIIRLDEHRDWGWLIVNYTYYRNLASEEQRREKTRLRVQAFREKNSDKPKSPETPAANHPGIKSRNPTWDEVQLQAGKIGLGESETKKFFAYYESNGWRVGKNPMKNWRMAMSGWKVRAQENQQPGFKTLPMEKPLQLKEMEAQSKRIENL